MDGPTPEVMESDSAASGLSGDVVESVPSVSGPSGDASAEMDVDEVAEISVSESVIAETVVAMKIDKGSMTMP